MKQTLTVSNIIDALLEDKNAGWSYPGAVALAEYLDNLDEETGEETELDVIAIRCEFSEFSSAAAAYEQQTGDEPDGDDEDEKEENALAYLHDNTTVIEFNGGIICQDY